MADNDLRAEYDRLLALFAQPYWRVATDELHHAALQHILRRLGPPEPLDGIEAEKLTDAGD